MLVIPHRGHGQLERSQDLAHASRAEPSLVLDLIGEVHELLKVKDNQRAALSACSWRVPKHNGSQLLVAERHLAEPAVNALRVRAAYLALHVVDAGRHVSRTTSPTNALAVDDGCMIAPAAECADVCQAQVGVLINHVHGNMPGCHYLALAGFDCPPHRR